MTVRHVVIDLVHQADVSKIPTWLRRASARVVRLGHGDRPFKALSLLSPPAKAFLRRYLEEDTKTLRVPTVPNVAIGLELADIIAIYRAPELAGTGAAFVLPINGWAWDHLHRHPELLDAALVKRGRGPRWWRWPGFGANTLRAR